MLSTVFNWTFQLSTVYDLTWVDSPRIGFQYNLTVIAPGAIVNIRATRCDGVFECGDDSDENGCGMEVDNTILAGKTLLTYIIFVRIFFSMYFLYSCVNLNTGCLILKCIK